MSLYEMKELLDDARTRKYGIGFYNTFNVEMCRACIRAAEDEQSPIIIGTAESLLKYCDFDWVAPMMLNAARNAKVPVAVHLDHAYNFDTIMKALKAGFGSVMFDGSVLPIEDNIEISARIAAITHPMGVGLECELGKVGGLEEGGGVIGTNLLTDTDEAAGFIDKTDADFLAISIGTTHGVYKEVPNLDLVRLSEIRGSVDIPLVLHGGSGLTDEDFQNCIKGGIQKINIYTDVITAGGEAIRDDNKEMGYADILRNSEEMMYEVVVDKIKIFGSSNKA